MSVEKTEAEIRKLQESLRNEGLSIAVDGIWGPATESALGAFQGHNDLIHKVQQEHGVHTPSAAGSAPEPAAETGEAQQGAANFAALLNQAKTITAEAVGDFNEAYEEYEEAEKARKLAELNERLQTEGFTAGLEVPQATIGLPEDVTNPKPPAFPDTTADEEQLVVDANNIANRFGVRKPPELIPSYEQVEAALKQYARSTPDYYQDSFAPLNIALDNGDKGKVRQMLQDVGLIDEARQLLAIQNIKDPSDSLLTLTALETLEDRLDIPTLDSPHNLFTLDGLNALAYQRTVEMANKVVIGSPHEIRTRRAAGEDFIAASVSNDGVRVPADLQVAVKLMAANLHERDGGELHNPKLSWRGMIVSGQRDALVQASEMMKMSAETVNGLYDPSLAAITNSIRSIKFDQKLVALGGAFGFINETNNNIFGHVSGFKFDVSQHLPGKVSAVAVAGEMGMTTIDEKNLGNRGIDMNAQHIVEAVREILPDLHGNGTPNIEMRFVNSAQPSSYFSSYRFEDGSKLIYNKGAFTFSDANTGEQIHFDAPVDSIKYGNSILAGHLASSKAELHQLGPMQLLLNHGGSASESEERAIKFHFDRARDERLVSNAVEIKVDGGKAIITQANGRESEIDIPLTITDGYGTHLEGSEAIEYIYDMGLTPEEVLMGNATAPRIRYNMELPEALQARLAAIDPDSADIKAEATINVLQLESVVQRDRPYARIITSERIDTEAYLDRDTLQGNAAGVANNLTPNKLIYRAAHGIAPVGDVFEPVDMSIFDKKPPSEGVIAVAEVDSSEVPQPATTPGEAVDPGRGL